jgi:hypothetical protein
VRIPPFDKDGDAFEELVEDVLAAEHPDLRRFSARGKDGAIDLSATSDERQGLLDVERDSGGVEGFLHWVDKWNPPKKWEVRRLIGYLRKTYPQTDIWDVVKFT